MKISILLLAIIASTSLFSQESGKEKLDDEIDQIDQISYDWALEADRLSSYQGLKQLCAEEAYRLQIFSLLKEVHHYDTILYEVLIQLSEEEKNQEVKKTLDDIMEFEAKYDTKSFIHFMNEECTVMFDIEKNAQKTKNDLGANSYHGQIYLLETELFKYVKHITAKVDKIRQHAHHLNEYYQN